MRRSYSMLLMVVTGLQGLSLVALEKKIVISHRGASSYLPEHTLEGVALAHGLGADYIEPDVVLTKDNHPIVLHDVELDDTTDVARVFPQRKRRDGKYYAIDFTLAEIKTLRVHERVDHPAGKAHFPSRFPSDVALYEIPTLREYILTVQGLNRSRKMHVGIYPEIKRPAFHEKEGKDITKIILAMLDEFGYRKRVSPIYLQCFNPRTLQRIRHEFKSELPLIQLVDDENDVAESVNYQEMRTAKGMLEIARYADGIGLWVEHLFNKEKDAKGTVTPSPLVRWARDAKLLVHVYTARNDQLPAFAPTFERLLYLLYVEQGVDGVFSDFTDLARNFLQRSGTEIL